MPKRTAIFTICSKNYLTQADVFFGSARDTHPDADLYLGLADDGDVHLDHVEVIPAESLRIPEFRSVAFGYDIMEFNTAIKPFLFLRLFERGYDDILYFDPDIMLFRRLDAVFDALEAGASFILTPHLCSPPGFKAPRREIDVMRTGVYNLGFLACSQQTETEPLLRWWARQLRYHCVNDQSGGLFVDQKFMDLMPGFAAHALVLRDTSMNVAYWNLAQRFLDRTEAGWSVDGQPLAFFHFSGFDPHEPRRVSKHVPDQLASGALADLLALYAEQMLRRPPVWGAPYGYARFDSGTTIPDLARHMFREQNPAWSEDPFATFEAHLLRPSPHATLGQSGEVVSNLMYALHARSAELRRRFDLGNRFHVTSFAKWFRQNATGHGIPERFV